MGLLKFLFYREKEKSVLTSKKYGVNQTKVEEEKSVFAKKSISLEDRRIDTDVYDREKCLLAGKYPKIEIKDREKEL